MPPERPYDWEHGLNDFKQEEDDKVEAMLDECRQQGWLSGDREFYPVWPTTLYEQDQIWATHFGLRTSEQRIERLAQEASMYKAANDIAHGS